MSRDTRFIAFLRAINVGGRTVKMDRLRTVFESLGFDSVATFIASGNVIFDAPRAEPSELERRIEAGLQAAFAFRVDTFLRSPAELVAVAALEPFPRLDMETKGHSLFVGFTRDTPPRAAVERLASLETDVDRLHVHGREVYWLRRGSGADSRLNNARIERALGTAATLRNVTTIRKLVAKY